MSFWAIVAISLIGAPMAASMAMMMAIFGGAGLANANRNRGAWTVILVGAGACWALASAFGAFGVVPAWRAWRGGAENFDGGLASFVHWLIGTGIVAGMYLAVWTLEARIRHDAATKASPSAALSWLRTTWTVLAFGAIAAWLIWPLLLWPLHGRLQWPDAATGWTHTIEVAAITLALGGLEAAVRKAFRR
jgi:hypothetical protein